MKKINEEVELFFEGQKPALLGEGFSWSYDELFKRACGVSERVKKGRILIFAENSPEWVAGLIGIWLSGGVAVPVDVLSSERELSFIAKDCEPEMVICSKNTLALARSIGVETLILEEIAKIKEPRATRRSLSEPAVILYTSGTTGRPRGVVLSFFNLLSNAEAVAKTGIAGPEDKTLALLPFHHSYPLMVTLILPLYLGASIVFPKAQSSEEIQRALKEFGVSVLVGVPRLYELMALRLKSRVLENPLGRVFYYLSPALPRAIRKLLFSRVHRAFGGKLRFMVSGGAKLSLEAYRVLSNLGFEVLEGYGLSETSPIVSFNRPGRAIPGSVGEVIDGTEVKISKEGEVLIKGPNVMVGYWKDPEATKSVIKEGWLHTGDIGRIQNGYLFIEGRLKEVLVLSGGKKVMPEEIEGLLYKAGEGLLKEVGVFELDGVLHAILVPDIESVDRAGILNIEEFFRWKVIDRVNQTLPEFKRIRGFKLYSGELERTRLGKLRRFKLPEIYKAASEVRALQKEVAKGPVGDFLKTLTGREVYLDEHLELDLGLDSLAKVELLSFIEKTYGIDLEEEIKGSWKVLDVIKAIEKGDKRSSLKEEIEFSDADFKFFLGRALLKGFFKLYNRLEVKLIEFPKEPFIIVANHASYVDGFVIAASLPEHVARKVYFLGAREHFTGRFRKSFGKMARVITIDTQKDPKSALSNLERALKSSYVVVIFPEGARSRDSNLLPFKRGFATLAVSLGVKVVPATIVGSFEVLSWKDKFLKPAKLKVIFSPPVEPKDEESLIEAVVKQIKSELDKNRAQSVSV
ncbi:MAG: AMP-binding protein [Aquificaceae bacterium]